MVKLNTKLTPLRYPGGKSNALNRLNSNLPKNFKEYREPFFGGGSVGLYLMQYNKSATYKLNDLFYPIYCFWKMMLEKPIELQSRIRELKQPYGQAEKRKWKKGEKKEASPNAVKGRELFDVTKKVLLDLEKNRGDVLETAARCYVINKLSFSGMMLQGTYAPLAWDQNFTDDCIENLPSIHDLMKSVKDGGGNIIIDNTDYRDFLNPEGDDIFIFLDPPYDIHCHLYGKDGELHEDFSHEDFATAVKNCKHKWLITYNDNEKIRGLFQGYEMRDWDLTYTMKSTERKGDEKAIVKVKYETGEEPVKSGKRGKELLISNYPLKDIPGIPSTPENNDTPSKN